MRAVVAGGIATFPVGGVAWDYGQYAVGLERLGFEVYYLEDTGLVAYDAPRREYSEDPTYGIEFLQRSLATLSPSLADRWHVRTADGRTYGMDPANLTELVAGADLFLNVSGLCLLRNEYMRCTCKVLIDTDPGWNHFVNYPRWDAYPGGREPTASGVTTTSSRMPSGWGRRTARCRRWGFPGNRPGPPPSRIAGRKRRQESDGRRCFHGTTTRDRSSMRA
jgi:hypothetical protein